MGTLTGIWASIDSVINILMLELLFFVILHFMLLYIIWCSLSYEGNYYFLISRFKDFNSDSAVQGEEYIFKPSYIN